MTQRSCFIVASRACCTVVSYRCAAIPIRIRMIVMTIINSMSVNPAPSSLTWRSRCDDLPVRICGTLLNSIPRANYQSQYLVAAKLRFFLTNDAVLRDGQCGGRQNQKDGAGNNQFQERHPCFG